MYRGQRAAMAAAVCVLVGSLVAVTPAGQVQGDKTVKAATAAPDSTESLLNDVQRLLDRQAHEMGALFDHYFDEKFFSSHENPFAELDAWQKKIVQNVEAPFKNALGNTWDSWYKDRFGTENIEVSTQKVDGKVVLDVTVPGVNTDAVSVDISGKRVKLEYNTRKVDEDKGADGKVIRRVETEQHMVKVLPVPEGVSTKGTTVLRTGKDIKIEFPPKA